MKTMRQHAFTLIELMITIGIAGIVLSLAVPALDSFIKNERMTSMTNTLLTDLMLARSKAVERNQPTVVCVSTDQAACTGGSFSDGWIAGIDEDGSGSIEAGEERLKVQQAITGDIRFNSTIGGLIQFDSRGFNPGAIGVISICDDRGVDFARTLSISRTGRVSRGADPTCP